MTLTTVTIGGTQFTSYATLAEANARLRVDPVRFTTWNALGQTDKLVMLVAATNRLDLLGWAGAKAGDPATQANAWPRTGLVYPDGTAVASTGVPTEVEVATILTAGSIAIKPAVANADGVGSGSNIEEVQAGTARVKFFRPIAGGPLQDQSALELIAFLLNTGGASLFGAATGTTASSSFSDADRNGLNDPFG